MQVEDLLEMIACLRVFKLPNFKESGELALEFCWHINLHIQEADLAGQLPRHGCDKFMHGPTEKDEVYLHGYVSRFVRDEMAVTFLEMCSQEAG